MLTRPEDLLNQLLRERGLKWATLCRRCESSPNRAGLKATSTSISPWKDDPNVAFGPSTLRPSAVSVCNVYREESSNVSPPLTSVCKDCNLSPRKQSDPRSKLTSVLFFFFYSQGCNTGLIFFVFVATVNDFVQYLFIGCVTLEWWCVMLMWFFKKKKKKKLTSCAIVSFECLRSLTLKPPLQMSICPSAVPLPQYECIVSKPQTFKAPLTLIRCRCVLLVASAAARGTKNKKK